jgi:hypothetical protein
MSLKVAAKKKVDKFLKHFWLQKKKKENNLFFFKNKLDFVEKISKSSNW